MRRRDGVAITANHVNQFKLVLQRISVRPERWSRTALFALFVGNYPWSRVCDGAPETAPRTMCRHCVGASARASPSLASLDTPVLAIAQRETSVHRCGQDHTAHSRSAREGCCSVTARADCHGPAESCWLYCSSADLFQIAGALKMPLNVMPIPVTTLCSGAGFFLGASATQHGLDRTRQTSNHALRRRLAVAQWRVAGGL